jgi:PqqD family protein of HPr-rel-A system
LRGFVGYIGLRRQKRSCVMREPSQWMAAPDLVWTSYDDSDEWVVYDPFSADVHLLTSSARVLWTLVADGQPHSIEDLVRTLAATLDRAPDDELTRFIRETLASMDRDGLIRPIAA